MDEEIRGVRQRKKNADPTCCPVCGITVRPSEMEQHYSLEMERLNKLNKKGKVTNSLSPRFKENKDLSGLSASLPSGCSSSGDGTANGTTNSDVKDCWSTYQRIKNNRNSRLKIQVRNKKRKFDDPVCPVCSMPISGDINIHVESCLKRSEKASGDAVNGGNSDEDENDSIDVEGESYEEYEWAGQTRIRASSLLEGGYSATGMLTSITNSTTNGDDEDLNVDGDDSQIYGSPQYTERDIIVPLAEDNTKENLYLRNLVIAQTAIPGTSSSPSRTAKIDSHQDEISHVDMDVCQSASTSGPSCSSSSGTGSSYSAGPSESTGRSTGDGSHHIIEALKAKIHEFEVIIKNKSKCLICMDDFRVPVVSICCWHVHCEECWLRTLGARKLCPQCNMITSATDLRRIYM